MKNAPVKIAIVDDHQIVIDGLKSLLSKNDHFRVTLSSNTAIEMLSLLKNNEVDILITDIMMPEMDGMALAREVKKEFPEIKILALSMNGQADAVNQMIKESDISGYMLKNIGQNELLHALQKIASGSVYFSKEILEEMMRAEDPKLKEDKSNLTQREIEIIRLIEKEKNNKEIATTLFISERTVETHRKNIYRKVKTTGLLGLVKYAYEHNLIERN